MFREIPEKTSTRSSVEKQSMARTLEVTGWGLFFVWVGVAAITRLGWGIGLLGVGVITLGMQLVRTRYGLMPETFWVVVGGLFLLAGLWNAFAVGVSLLPVLFLAVGVALLWSVIAQRHRVKERHL